MELTLALAAALGGGALWLRDFMEGERLLTDLWYEHRLAGLDLRQLDARCAAQGERSEVVVCLTTLPSRLPLLAPALKSLLNQSRAPRAIRLHLPRFSRREQCAYPIPEELRGLRCVRIVECERDWGPATKSIPALLEFPDAQPLLIVDDDRIYPPGLIAELEAAARTLPGAALGMSGWNAPPDRIDRPTTVWSNLWMQAPAPVRGRRLGRPRQVDILQGMSGYWVEPGFFDRAALIDYASAPEAAFYVDDVWIGAHCRAPKFVIPTHRSNFPVKRWFVQHKRSSLGYLNRGGGDVLQRHNTIMLKHFTERWMAQRVSG
ncbi:MAG: hypothetical protein HZB71_08140 [Betaproteobacteria bacterium]|nr:hypothetical protein [Betaproteobacteria bacterium]